MLVSKAFHNSKLVVYTVKPHSENQLKLSLTLSISNNIPSIS